MTDPTHRDVSHYVGMMTVDDAFRIAAGAAKETRDRVVALLYGLADAYVDQFCEAARALEAAAAVIKEGDFFPDDEAEEEHTL
jgi:hypothetical protein